MHLKIGDRVRLTEDVISDFLDRGEIYVSGTKGSIAIILSPEEFLRDDPYKQIYTHEKITTLMVDGKWYPIRYETKAPLVMIPSSDFEIIDYCREGGVALVSVRQLEKLHDNSSQVIQA